MEVYEVNRSMDSVSHFADMPELQQDGAVAVMNPRGDSVQIASIDQYIEVLEVEVGGKKVKYVRELPPDRVAELGGLSPQEAARLARTQAAGALMVGGMLQTAANASLFGSVMKQTPAGLNAIADALDGGGDRCAWYVDRMSGIE